MIAASSSVAVGLTAEMLPLRALLPILILFVSIMLGFIGKPVAAQEGFFERDRLTGDDIEASELSVRSVRAIKQTVSARKYGKMIIAAPVVHHVAQLCDCMYWGSTEETGKHYTFFGLPADAEIAAYLFDLISNGIATEVGIYKVSSDYLTATGTHGRTLVSSFIAGMEDRICARLEALREEKHSAIEEATGRSLVVVKAAQIEEDFKVTGIRLVSSGIRRSTGGSGYANGQVAGDRLPLSRGVGARRSAGML